MIGEPAFPEVVEDASDIPVDVVKRYIASGSVDDGFLVAVDGGLLRTSASEDVESGLMAHIFLYYWPPPNAVDAPLPESPKTNIIKTGPNLTVKANLPLDDREDDYF
ncbi:hypothetical protein BYT27DRAFT_7250464 [Phlegmacium glaucopus]|nr:hypothetical protein BYT27DRAFT_7250464 [Phlegmacium glaucopus]